MSDIPHSRDNPDVVEVRDGKGRFAPGVKMGGRTPHPDWFKARGPEILRLQVAVGMAETEGLTEAQKAIVLEVDPDTRSRVRESLIDRIYGKAKQQVEVEATGELTPAMAALLALAVAGGEKKKEDEK